MIHAAEKKMAKVEALKMGATRVKFYHSFNHVNIYKNAELIGNIGFYWSEADKTNYALVHDWKAETEVRINY